MIIIELMSIEEITEQENSSLHCLLEHEDIESIQHLCHTAIAAHELNSEIEQLRIENEKLKDQLANAFIEIADLNDHI